MLISDFDYHLPPELIAQAPSEPRDASRMLVVDRRKRTIEDRTFAELPSYFGPTDIFVFNNTRVFPARLIGRSESGAAVEIFLIAETAPGLWEALTKPARRLPKGKNMSFGGGLRGKVEERLADGRALISFESARPFFEVIEEIGKTPLPPYIRRGSEDPSDRERYQTVYARNRGAIAAPTAGLHFTASTLDALRANGVSMAEITLHVGYGTFEPVRVDDLSEHSVMAERYSIDPATADALNSARSSNKRFVAVGTTTTRALEADLGSGEVFTAREATAALTITPGYSFRAVDALLTNFHLPKSSLLVLVSTFGGYELIMDAYKHAVAERYRFYSYGDCMLIL